MKKNWVLCFKLHPRANECLTTIYVKDFANAVFEAYQAKRFLTENDARQYKENHSDTLWTFAPLFIPDDEEN